MNNRQTTIAKQHHRAVRVAGAAALTLALGATLVGCSSSSKADASDAPTTTVQSASSIADSPTTVASGGNGQSGGGQSGGGQSNTPVPSIVSFTTPENIDCHNGNLQNFTASWSTKNAVKVTISIDGPGIYKTYPATGSDSLPFNCSSAHRFKLTAFNANGDTASRTITLQPRNVQVPSTDDPGDTTPTT